MSTLRVSNIEAKADPSSPSVDEKLKVTNSNGDILVHIDGKTAGVTTIGINTTDRSFTVDAAQNVEFLGIVTATKFSLSGGGEITGGDGNFTGIVTSGSGNFTGGLSVGTAVTAATANFTSSLTAASANFTGNVSIAGTLTYEDVTNVDSIGIATARTGIDVTGGHIDLVDDSRIRVGTGNDLEIYHDGANSYVQESGTGALRLVGNQVAIRNNAENMAVFNTNAEVKLYYDNSKKFETTGIGVSVTGSIEVTQEYPSIRPTLDLNFAATKTLDRRITFTRDGVGTYVDDMGIIKYASNNTPRFDHDPDTRESLGLLIEESRTNLLTYSDLVSGEGLGTGWAIGGSRASKGSNATAPDGTLSAWKSVYNGTGGDASLYKVGGEVTTSNSTEHTLSIFAKVPSTNTYITGVRIRTFNNNHSATFNLLTGTIVGGVEGTTTRRMEAYPNGWYRCSITFTSGTDGNQGVQYYMTNSSNSTSLNDSNANGEEIHYWGAQLEAGSFPTSYIPTSSSTVTRGQDFAIIKGTNFTDIFDTSFKQFSLLVDYDNTKTVDGTTYSIIDLWGESTGYDDRIEWFKDNESPYHIETRAFGQGNATFVNGNLSASSKAKAQRFATSWYVPDYSNASSRRFVVSMGGEAVDVISDGSGTTVPQLTRMGIGCNPTRLDFSAGLTHFKKVVVYNKTLPDAQLQGLTQQ